MKIIDIYEYLDFCIPARVQQMTPKKVMYSGLLGNIPLSLANIEIFLISYDKSDNSWVIYFESDEEGKTK